MRLSARRFPDRITRRRQAPDDYNAHGEWTPGVVEEVERAASVQPLSVEDVDTVEGSRFSERLKVYVPEPDALGAAFDDREADHVVIDGREYVVEESRSWASFTVARVLRQT